MARFSQTGPRTPAICFAALLCSIQQGCGTTHVNTFDQAAKRAALSPSFSQLTARNSEPVVIMNDGRDGGYFYLYVGESHDDHSCRLMTLRVRESDGLVERLETDSSADDRWVPERLSVR